MRLLLAGHECGEKNFRAVEGRMTLKIDGFASLAFGAFYCAVPFMPFYEFIII